LRDLDLLRRVAHAAGIAPAVLGVSTGFTDARPVTVINSPDLCAEEDALRRREMLVVGPAAASRLDRIVFSII